MMVPMELAMMPLPTPLITPPLTKMYFILLQLADLKTAEEWKTTSEKPTASGFAATVDRPVDTGKSLRRKSNWTPHGHGVHVHAGHAAAGPESVALAAWGLHVATRVARGSTYLYYVWVVVWVDMTGECWSWCWHFHYCWYVTLFVVVVVVYWETSTGL